MVSCLKSYEFLSKKCRNWAANDFSVGESYLAGWHGNKKKHRPRCMLYLRLKSLSVTGIMIGSVIGNYSLNHWFNMKE